MTAPLDDVRILDMTNFMAGPSAAAILADLGADVVKVEPLRGDIVRNGTRQPRKTPGVVQVDASFQADNRGKRSIAVAVDRPEGAEVVRRLASKVDVFLSNLLPHRQERFGLDPPSLFARHPRLVHATFSGHGLTGPDANRPAFDVTTFFARGSLTDSMGEPGLPPPWPRPAQGDHTSSLALVAGILAALRLAERTGEGQVLDCNLLATAAWTQVTDLSVALVDGYLPSKRDRRHHVGAMSNCFLCQDNRWIMINMTEARYWPLFCNAIGRPEWNTDERFATLKARFENIAELTDLMDEIFATRTLAEWGSTFDTEKLIWGPVATLVELAVDPQAETIGMYPYIDHPAGRFRTVAAPMFIRGANVGPRGPAPELGEHTREVLLSAGYSDDEVLVLHQDGVVGIA